MALSQSALSELLDAFRAGDGVDLVRESVRVALQELIELEATEQIGAAPYERTQDRTSERNGHQARTLTTKAGDVQLRIPKLRKGSFFPIMLEPRRRIDQALYAVVMEAYVHGVSTRSVEDLVEAMGGTGISKSEVSRICSSLDETVGAFRTRTLGLCPPGRRHSVCSQLTGTPCATRAFNTANRSVSSVSSPPRPADHETFRSAAAIDPCSVAMGCFGQRVRVTQDSWLPSRRRPMRLTSRTRVAVGGGLFDLRVAADIGLICPHLMNAAPSW